MTVAQRDSILAAGTPEEAARLIDQYYERSDGKSREKRAASARNYAGAQQAPEEHDLNAIYSSIDADADKDHWSPEKREAMKAQASRIVQRDETLLARKRSDADDAATAVEYGLGDKFTDISMIPDALRKDMTPVKLAAATARAKENKDRAFATANADPKPNGPAQLRMTQLRYNDPGAFMNTDPNTLRGKVSSAELDTIVGQQAEMRKGSNEWTPLPGVGSAYNRGAAMNGFVGKNALDPDKEVAVKQIMEAEANQLFRARKGAPLTDRDYDDLYRSATRNVVVNSTGMFGGVTKTLEPRYALTYDEIPNRQRDLIVDSYKRAHNGAEPDHDTVLRAYRAGSSFNYGQ